RRRGCRRRHSSQAATHKASPDKRAENATDEGEAKAPPQAREHPALTIDERATNVEGTSATEAAAEPRCHVAGASRHEEAVPEPQDKRGANGRLWRRPGAAPPLEKDVGLCAGRQNVGARPWRCRRHSSFEGRQFFATPADGYSRSCSGERAGDGARVLKRHAAQHRLRGTLEAGGRRELRAAADR